MPRWSDIRIMKFLDVYEKHECLWNPRVEAYKNKMAKDYALDEMIQELNMPGLTRHDIKLKIKSVRTTYKRELSALMNAAKDKGRVFIPKLFWFKRADSFLRHVSRFKKDNSDVKPYIENFKNSDFKESISIIETVQTPHVEYKIEIDGNTASLQALKSETHHRHSNHDDDPLNCESFIEEDDETAEAVHVIHMTDEGASQGDNEDTSDEQHTSHNHHQNDNDLQHETMVIEEQADEMHRQIIKTEVFQHHHDFRLNHQSHNENQSQQIQQQHESQEENHQLQSDQQQEQDHLSAGNAQYHQCIVEDDDYNSFGRSVGAQLRTIPDSYSRSVAKLKIQQILFEAETGHYRKKKQYVTI